MSRSFGNLRWWAQTLQERIQILIWKERASRLYGHPLVSTLAKEKKLPSYIGSGTFASVLVDSAGTRRERQAPSGRKGPGGNAGRQFVQRKGTGGY